MEGGKLCMLLLVLEGRVCESRRLRVGGLIFFLLHKSCLVGNGNEMKRKGDNHSMI